MSLTNVAASIMPKVCEDWIQLDLEEVIFPSNYFSSKVKSRDIKTTGKFPVIDQGENFITGYTDDEAICFKGRLPVIVFGDHTRRFKYINFNFAVASNGTKTLCPHSILNAKFFFYYLSSLKIPSQGYSRHYRLLKAVKIPVPHLDEQALIVRKLDSAFEKFDRIKDKLNNVNLKRDHIINNFLFNTNFSKFHKIRLDGVLVERNDRIGDKWKGIPLIGVDAHNGVTNLRSGGKTSFKNYKIVKKGDILYNPMRINIGSVALNEVYETALTSPDYIVFSIVDKLISSRLLIEYLKSNYGALEIKNNTQGSVRSRLYFKNLTNIDFPVNSAVSQNHIEETLSIFYNFNKKSGRIIDLLDSLKTTLFQKAFSGDFSGEDVKTLNEKDLLNEIKFERDQNKHQYKESQQASKSTKMVKEKGVDEIQNKLTLSEVLRLHGGKLTSKELWQLSSFKDDIDAFYSSLKIEIESNNSIKEDSDKQYLVLNK